MNNKNNLDNLDDKLNCCPQQPNSSRSSDFKIKNHNKKDVSSKSFITYKDGNQKYYSLRVNFVWMTRFLEISLINIPNLDCLKLLSCHSRKPISDFNETELG